MADAVFSLALDDAFTGGVKAAQAAWARLGNSASDFDKRLKGVAVGAQAKQFAALKSVAVDSGLDVLGKDASAMAAKFKAAGGSTEMWNARVKGLRNAKLGKEFGEITGTAKQTAEGLDIAKLAAAGLTGVVSGGTTAALQLAASAASAAGQALASLGVSFIQGAAGAAQWGTQTKNLLTALNGGDAKKAASQIEEIKDVARSTGGSLDEATAAFVEFSKAGMADGFARNLAKIRADAAVMGPEFASAVDSLKDMKGSAVPTVDQFDKLSKIVGGADKLAEALGIPKSATQNAAKLQAELAKIKPESFSNVFANLGAGAGKIARDSKPVWTQIQNDIGTAFADAFGGVDLTPITKLAKDVVAQLGPALKGLAPLAQQAIGGLVSGAQAVQANWPAVVATFQRFQPLLIVVGAAALGAATAVGAVALAAAAAAVAVLEAANAISGVIVSFAQWTAGAQSAASAMIQGIVAGISSGASAVAAAMTSLAGTALSAFQSTLGIASPSKVFAEQGGYIAEGAASGIAGGAGSVQMAADAMAPTPAAPSGGGSSGGNTITINVTAGSGATEIATEIERTLRRALTELG